MHTGSIRPTTAGLTLAIALFTSHAYGADAHRLFVSPYTFNSVSKSTTDPAVTSLTAHFDDGDPINFVNNVARADSDSLEVDYTVNASRVDGGTFTEPSGWDVSSHITQLVTRTGSGPTPLTVHMRFVANAVITGPMIINLLARVSVGECKVSAWRELKPVASGGLGPTESSTSCFGVGRRAKLEGDTLIVEIDAMKATETISLGVRMDTVSPLSGNMNIQVQGLGHVITGAVAFTSPTFGSKASGGTSGAGGGTSGAGGEASGAGGEASGAGGGTSNGGGGASSGGGGASGGSAGSSGSTSGGASPSPTAPEGGGSSGDSGCAVRGAPVRDGGGMTWAALVGAALAAAVGGRRVARRRQR